VRKNSPFSGTVAEFTDGDPAAVASDFTVTINWGDHTANSTGSVGTAKPPSIFLAEGNHTYTSSGKFTITVTIKDAGGTSVTVTSTADVPGPLATPPPDANALDAPTLAALDSLYADGSLFTAGPCHPPSSYGYCRSGGTHCPASMKARPVPATRTGRVEKI
jgi:hypothetical protein